jgi:hypothetical protein
MMSWDKFNKKEETPKDPKLKGKLRGNCNRTSCQKPNAVFYNSSTQAHYCHSCARLINESCSGLCLMDPDYKIEQLKKRRNAKINSIIRNN